MEHQSSDQNESSSDDEKENYDADRSTEESIHPVSLRTRKQINKANRESRSDDEESQVPKNVAYSPGSWPRRKKDKFEKSPEELLRQFREMSAEHMSKIRSIYSDSRRKIDDLLLSLKLTMTKNGYSRPDKQRS